MPDVNPYLPRPYKLVSLKKETEIDYTFTFESADRMVGGQFMQLSMPGVGEAPISISDFDGTTMDMTIRKVGRLTDKIFEMKAGDHLFMRGPYGNGFDLTNYDGRDLVVIAGGTGLAPVKKTIAHYMANPQDVKSLEVLVGFKSPQDILFPQTLKEWSGKARTIITVDNPSEGWDGETGLIPSHIAKFDLSNVAQKVAIVVGPPIMMKFTTLELIKQGFKEENIWVSFERKMSCGIGKCGHCKIDETYVCLEGPVFNYTKAKSLID